MKPKTKAELAADLGVSAHTLRRWLIEAGLVTGRRKLLTVSELNRFYLLHGKPDI